MPNRITLSSAKSPKGVVVHLEGKVAGHIRKITEVGIHQPIRDGYKYFPKGSKTGGDTFPSVTACFNSLLDEKD